MDFHKIFSSKFRGYSMSNGGNNVSFYQYEVSAGTRENNL